MHSMKPLHPLLSSKACVTWGLIPVWIHRITCMECLGDVKLLLDKVTLGSPQTSVPAPLNSGAVSAPFCVVDH